VDVLVLFGGAIGGEEEQFLRRLLHPLWDQSIDVSHQIRDLDDLAALDSANPTFLIALADARPLAGSPALFERVKAVVAAATTRAFLVESLTRLVADR